MTNMARDIVSKLTLEEKAALCMGKDFWHLVSIERLGLSEIMVTDGPHGLRKQKEKADHAGINKSIPATCFPAACTTASSWDINLINEMGKAMADEARQEEVSVILGPGANIKRSPLCGRNFEYFSEDPYHTGRMAASFVNGVQSKQIGTSLKHFVMNNQEKLRMTIDSVVDERAQREIYLAGFEECVKSAKPWTVMCSYNKVDGEYLSENKRLLTNVLRDEWGFKGLVVTDWGAVYRRDKGIEAGLDLEMPASGPKNIQVIIDAVNSGTLLTEELDNVVLRVVELILKSQDAITSNYKYDAEAHHELAKKIAGESAVLLKNDNMLPLDKDEDIAIIGEFAKIPRYQGAGSSLINPTKLDNICCVLDDKGYKYEYSAGYSVKSDSIDSVLISEAVKTAENHKAVIIFAGLTDEYESEGFDRNALDIPENQRVLIEEVAKVNENAIVVLSNGAPIVMPWLGKVKAVIEGYLYGQAGAGAIIDIIFGDICPSGKLAETFPLALQDNPSYNYFPGYTRSVEYRESIYVGYRYYDKAKKNVLFPFGYGLSYTEFKYSDLKVKKNGDFNYTVTLDIENTGDCDGAEVVQLYVKNNESPIFKVVKELKGFHKVFLKKDEKKQIEFKLNKRSFAYYNVNIKDWHVDSGTYGVLIGSSSTAIRLNHDIEIKADDEVKIPDYRDTLPCYYELSDDILSIDEKKFEKLLGRKLPERQREKDEDYDLESTLGDIKDTFIGKIINKIAAKKLKELLPDDVNPEEDTTYTMMRAMVKEMPLKSFGMMGDNLPPYSAEAIAALANRKVIEGLRMFLKK